MLISVKKLERSHTSSFFSIKLLVNFAKQVSWRYFMLHRLLYFSPALFYSVGREHWLPQSTAEMQKIIPWFLTCRYNNYKDFFSLRRAAWR